MDQPQSGGQDSTADHAARFTPAALLGQRPRNCALHCPALAPLQGDALDPQQPWKELLRGAAGVVSTMGAFGSNDYMYKASPLPFLCLRVSCVSCACACMSVS